MDIYLYKRMKDVKVKERFSYALSFWSDTRYTKALLVNVVLEELEMKKRLISALLLCFAALLFGVLAMRPPQQTHAQAPRTPAALISVSPKTLTNANCTPMNAGGSDLSSGYQACTLSVSTSTNWIPNGLHWSVSSSANFCYKSCSSANSYIALIKGSGGTLYGSGIKQQVLVIVPRTLFEGTLQTTFTFTGQGNTVKIPGSFY
jgi:hypothetical protein